MTKGLVKVGLRLNDDYTVSGVGLPVHACMCWQTILGQGIR